MPKRLCTIGYEGSRVEDLVKTLSIASVRLLLDVREIPLSRKPGFSKSSLAVALEAADIEYVHLRELGDPKEGREAARSGNLAHFKKVYSQHLRRPEAKAELKVAVELAQRDTACLLCFERKPQDCHRFILAAEMVKSSEFEVKHLGVLDGIARRPAAELAKYERRRIHTIG